MPLPLLAIAKGAFAVGKKLFAGIKKRKEKKAAKKAEKAAAAQNSLTAFNEQAATLGLNFGGATPISESGNLLQQFMKGKTDPPLSPDAPPVGGGGNDPMSFLKTPAGMGVAAIALLILLKVMKIIK